MEDRDADIRTTMQPTCPQCGYILTGLREPTCPECGFGFDADSLRVLSREPSDWQIVTGWLLETRWAWAGAMVLNIAAIVYRWEHFDFSRIAEWILIVVSGLPMFYWHLALSDGELHGRLCSGWIPQIGEHIRVAAIIAWIVTALHVAGVLIVASI